MSVCHQGGHVMKYAIFFLTPSMTPSIPDAEVWAVMGFTLIIPECPEDHVFMQAHVQSPIIPEVQEHAVKLPQEVLHMGDLNENISACPENIPTAATTTHELDPVSSLFCK